MKRKVSVCLLLIFCSGCASAPHDQLDPGAPVSRRRSAAPEKADLNGETPALPAAACARRFEFERDTFAYPNELVWEYRCDANGKWTTRRRATKPSYSQHCFVVSRCACQFFENAVFDPALL